MEIDISKMKKAEVLAALFNASKPQGLGLFSDYEEKMSVGEAQELLDAGQNYFDYVRGRVLKVDLRRDVLKTDLYDRDNGPEAALNALDSFRTLEEFQGEQEDDWLKEICANCGLTRGDHHAGSSPWPHDYCPGNRGRMDWENGPGTVFSPTGRFERKEI